MGFYSPLRYPGGKGKLSEFLKLIFKNNLLCDGHYVEPYAGGASVALDLLFSEYAGRVVINDLDRSVYSFWHSTIYRTEELCELINKASLSLAGWRRQKEIQLHKSNCSLLKLGFSTFYLNRTNRSGILNGGVIGGINQKGTWKIDARFNKSELINRIRRIGSYKDRVSVYNLDACELIRKIVKSIPRKTLFYLDPPYFHKGQKLYVNYYKPEDHEVVAKTVMGLKNCRWVVSYDYTPEITKLYHQFPRRRYSINYSASKHGKGDEVMFFSDNLTIPAVKNPIKV